MKDFKDFFYWARRELRRRRATMSEEANFSSSPIDLSKLAQKRNRQTLYILGTGSSVNQISKEQWSLIAKEDSIGLNFWPIHDFVPTYWMFEASRDRERNARLVELFEEKKVEYRGTTILIKSISSIADDFFGDFFKRQVAIMPVRDIALPDQNRSLMRLVLRSTFDISMKFRHSVIYGRGSMSLAVMLGIRLGYSNIVFVGCDLNDGSYFWDGDGRFSKYPSGITNAPHNILKRESLQVNILDVIREVAPLAVGRGAFLYTLNPNSALAEVIPSWSFGGSGVVGAGFRQRHARDTR